MQTVKEYAIARIGGEVDRKAAEELLAVGVNINKSSWLGYSMLLHAIPLKHENISVSQQKVLEFIEFLITSGAEFKSSIASTDADGQPDYSCWMRIPFLKAAASPMGVPIMELLLRKGVDINSRDETSGMTALHVATWFCNVPVVLFLIDKQQAINLNAQDSIGRTLLINAAYWGCSEIILALVWKGADKNIKDAFGKTASDYVKDSLNYAKDFLDMIGVASRHRAVSALQFCVRP